MTSHAYFVDWSARLPECRFAALCLMITSPVSFLLEGISPNFNLLCKLVVSQLAAIFGVLCVNLELMLCLNIFALPCDFHVFCFADTGIMYWHLEQNKCLKMY